MSSHKKYSNEESDIVLNAFGHGLSDEQIIAELHRNGFTGRTEQGLKNVRKRRGLVRADERKTKREVAPVITSRPRPDLAFVQAMVKAAKSGKENIILGVMKDHRPVKIAPAYRPETFVATQSALAD